MTLLLRESEVAALLPMEAAIGIMERALAAFSSGAVLQPVRQALAIDPHAGYLGLMPAHLRSGGGGGAEALGAKAVTFYTGNAARGLPTHMAVILLWDAATGALLAIMDGRLITEVRTAATSAAAAKILARPEAGMLALLGSGVQARSHLEAFRHVRAIREVRVWSRTPAHAEALVREAGASGVAARSCPTAEEAVRGADLLVTVTSSPTPVLRGRWISPGAHVTAVGAPRPDWRELDAEAVARARVFVDSRAGALAESGDLLGALKEGAIDEGHIAGEIGGVLAGAVRGRTTPQEITLFKSLGMAVEDVATASYVYQQARARGAGREVEL
ncbi:MAG TPA: ornithine cyclodeaminase family protein [Gemmatimonadales bacterium]|nr:ornithine cyclodeaminase family protein [Gemmatimonadales bacterium]